MYTKTFTNDNFSALNLVVFFFLIFFLFPKLFDSIRYMMSVHRLDASFEDLLSLM